MEIELNPAGPATSDDVAEYVALRSRREKLEADLKPVKAEMARLEELIAADFLRLGKTKETRYGVTVYIARHLSVKVLDPATLREGMQALGHVAMLSVHASRLKAFLREALHNNETDEWAVDPQRIPAEIRDSVAVAEYHKIQARRS